MNIRPYICFALNAGVTSAVLIVNSICYWYNRKHHPEIDPLPRIYKSNAYVGACASSELNVSKS